MHGGETLQAAAWIDDGVRERLLALTELAPLHQPRALAAIDAVALRLPDVPAAACFDTAFHATLPPAAATYALPSPWPRRRFGFHGLSHAYASRRTAELLGAELGTLRVVSCHLGAGARNAAAHGDADIGADGARVRTLVVTAREDLEMARQVRALAPPLAVSTS